MKNIVACDIDDAKLAPRRSSARRSPSTPAAPDAAQKLQGIAGAHRLRRQPGHRRARHRGAAQGRPLRLVGLYGGELVHPLPPIAQRAIGIVGSYVGSLQELKEVVALAKKRKLKPSPIETRPADQANSALEDLKAGRVLGRVVLISRRVAA